MATNKSNNARATAKFVRAREAYRLTNEFVLDLIVGTRVTELYEHPAMKTKIGDAMSIGLTRLVVSHLVITLSKWSEFYRRYKAVIPMDVRDACLQTSRDIERRGIVRFRNRVVGHVWDNELQRALTRSEIQSEITSIIGDSDAFSLWVNNPHKQVFPTTVVSVAERARDRIETEYGFSAVDLNT